MFKKILPVILALLGVGAGIGAGLVLKPEPAEMVEINPCGEDAQPDAHADTDGPGDEHGGDGNEYVKLNNQFVVPIITGERVSALVVMSLSLEVRPGETETVYTREPKLRDVFLQVLFDHANIGGFRGAFTSAANMEVLRSSLLSVAQKTGGAAISDVLITDLARQDV
ncbi:flagellar basal body-associated FliL family protein [Thalassovita taeanensis]|uniref:Flagellar protein FliL n=1 Tax=Thalassovita taeanensis TaxID=657014 RepID=A0A1H9I889_9RHOB|nr:flagellar basal body-associated FliL family protein [Thalassovita taeanensis]SEQ70756.1 Flagellar basal body-associated protein FliL [Thalassovita taeanensis]